MAGERVPSALRLHDGIDAQNDLRHFTFARTVRAGVEQAQICDEARFVA
jgi:hypothetical protein